MTIAPETHAPRRWLGRRVSSCTRAALLALAIAACDTADPAREKVERIRLGEEALAQKKYARAASEFARAVKADPRDGQLRMKLAETALLAEKWKQASDEAARAADLLPGDENVQLRAAELMLDQQRFVDVQARMTAILKQQPDNVNALMLLGNAIAHIQNSAWAIFSLAESILNPYEFTATRGDIRPGTARSDDEAAEAAFRSALQLAPESMEVKFAFANFLWATGRPDEAEPHLKAFADGYPGHALANHALGNFYLSRRRDREGERYLKEASKQGPAGRDARFSLADHYVRAGRTADAIALLTSMLAADDQPSRDVTIGLARVEFRSDQREQAVARIDALLATQPNHAGGQLLKAQFLTAARDWNAALPLARTALAAEPKSSEAHAVIGDILFGTGDLEGAFASYGEAFRLNPAADRLPVQLARVAVMLGRGADAVQTARDAKRRQPNDAVATLALAQALALTDSYDAAESTLRPLIDNGAPSSAVQTLLGRIRAGRGNRAGAREAFTRALQLDPKAADAIDGLVRLDLQERSVRAARQRVERALAGDPDDSRLLLLSADVSIAASDLPGAERTLRRAANIDSSHLDAVLSLADVLAKQGRRGDAQDALVRFLERRPTSTAAQTRLAMLLEEGGQLEEAKSWYEQIVARDRRAARAASRLAALHVELKGNLDVALDLAILAKQQLPKDADVADILGCVYAAKNVTGRALPHLRDAVRAAPDNPLYRFHLGQAYLQAGDRTKARDELTKALTLDRNFRHAGKTREILSSLK